MATDTADSVEVQNEGPLARLRSALEGPNTVGSSRRFWIGFAVVAALFGAYPLLFGPNNAFGFSLFYAYAFLGLSLSVIWGYGGILSFGQVVFFGIGGYTYGIIAINYASPLGSTAGLFGGVLAGALSAFLLGYFMFYGGVTDVYVTIITLVATLALKTFMDQTAGDAWTIGSAALGGFNGMTVPQLTLGVGETAMVFFNSTFYWLLFGLLLVTYLGLRAFVNSDFGRVAVAIREDEDRTRMFGYDVKKVKLILFTIGGALAGLGGVAYATYQFTIQPTVFALSFAALPVVWVSVGGRTRLLGALVGTIPISYLNRWLSINAPDFALVFIGALLLGVVLFLPDGIVPRVESVVERFSAGGGETAGEPSPEVSD